MYSLWRNVDGRWFVVFRSFIALLLIRECYSVFARGEILAYFYYSSYNFHYDAFPLIKPIRWDEAIGGENELLPMWRISNSYAGDSAVLWDRLFRCSFCAVVACYTLCPLHCLRSLRISVSVRKIALYRALLSLLSVFAFVDTLSAASLSLERSIFSGFVITVTFFFFLLRYGKYEKECSKQST